MILDAVRAEAVDAGLSGAHPDAAAIEAALVGMRTQESDASLTTVDAMVLDAARRVGLLVANDPGARTPGPQSWRSLVADR